MFTRKSVIAFALAAFLSLGLAAAPADAAGTHMMKGGKTGCPMMKKKGCPMSDAHMKMMHEAMKKAFAENKPLMKQAGDLHKQMDAVMTAKKFDAKAYLSLSDKMGALHDKMMRNHAKAFASVAGKLSQDERKDMAAHRMMGMQHGMHGKMHGGMMHGWGAMHDGGRKSWFSHLNQ